MLKPLPASLVAESLRRHAARTPRHLALVADGRPVSYLEFAAGLPPLLERLRALPLRPGMLAAINIDDVYLHWKLIIGFEMLGIATASYQDREAAIYDPLLRSADLILGGADAARPSGVPVFEIPSTWDTHPSPSPLPPSPLPPAPNSPAETLIRLTQGSGSTGDGKIFGFNRWQWQAKIRRRARMPGFPRGGRYMMALPFSVPSVLISASACLLHGGTVIAETRMQLFETLAAVAPCMSFMLPLHLEQMLAALPPDWRKPAGVALWVGGGPIAPRLRAGLLERIADTVVSFYGTNETDRIGVTAPDGVTQLFTDIAVEVVDDRGQPLPYGEAGTIRLRSAVLADGYRGNPEADARAFRGGWFYPGDVGMLLDARRLRVLGRDDDLVNVQGLKLSCPVIEAQIRDSLPVAEVAVLSGLGRPGLKDICVALVAAPEQHAAIAEGLRAEVFPPGAELSIGFLIALPRTPNGKIQRAAIRAALAATETVPPGH